MKKTITHYIVFVILVFFTFSNKGLGQSLKTYEGLYNFGTAKYTYYNTEDGRVCHGNFYYKNGSYTLQGNYENGKRVGEWIERSGSSDVYFEIKKNYKKGVLNGTYQYAKIRFSAGVRKIEWQQKVNIKDGDCYTGNYSYFDNSNNIAGDFDNNGFYDGKWLITDILFEETRIYNHGILVRARTINRQTGQVVYKYDNRIFQSILNKLPDYIKMDSVKIKATGNATNMEFNLVLNSLSDNEKDVKSITGYRKVYSFIVTDSFPSVIREIKTASKSYENNSDLFFEKELKSYIINKKSVQDKITLLGKAMEDLEDKNLITDSLMDEAKLQLLGIKLDSIKGEISRQEELLPNINESYHHTLSSKNILYIEPTSEKIISLKVDSIESYKELNNEKLYFSLNGKIAINGKYLDVHDDISMSDYDPIVNDESFIISVVDHYNIFMNGHHDDVGDVRLFFNNGIIIGYYTSYDKVTRYDFLLVKAFDNHIQP